MGWDNPPIPWAELERRLSGRRPDGAHPGDGGDSPAWSRRRGGYVPPGRPQATDTVPYAELHCHSNFSFLDGASHPEELVEEAVRLGLEAIALTDHDGMYGVVRFAEAARAYGMRTIYGAELSLGLTAPQGGNADPQGRHLLVLARDPDGYRRLCRQISAAQLAGGAKGRPVYDPDELAGAHDGHWLVLTGCRKGTVPAALAGGGTTAARGELDELVGRFGRDNVAVELWHHGDPLDDARNDALAELAAARGLPTVATGNVHFAGAAAPPAGHRAGRGPGPPQPGRDGRLAARGGHGTPALRRRDGRPVRPLPRARWPGPPSWAWPAPSTWTWSRPQLPDWDCPPGTPR